MFIRRIGGCRRSWPVSVPTAVCNFSATKLREVSKGLRSSYVNKDREITRKFVQHATKRGIKGLFITVDAPQLGRREKVRRVSKVLMRLSG